MYTTANEIAKTFLPLANFMSYQMFNLINFFFEAYAERKNKEHLNDLINVLKIEYPNEAADYIEYMAKKGNLENV